MKARAVVSLFFVAAWACNAQTTIRFSSLSAGVLEARLRQATPKISVRYERLRSLFESTGCQHYREQPVKHSKEPNVICTIPAATADARKIIVGAHYDSAGGDGVVDNWTGAILLPSLAQFIAESPRQHTFEFVGFAAEEKGLLGSKAYLKSLSPEERERIAAVITMDSLGISPTKWQPSDSDIELAKHAAAIAHSLKQSFAGVSISRKIGYTDSLTFYEAKLPTLSLHSITQETFRLINSPKDVWSLVSWQDYYDSHKLVSALLVYLDVKLNPTDQSPPAP